MQNKIKAITMADKAPQQKYEKETELTEVRSWALGYRIPIVRSA